MITVSNITENMPRTPSFPELRPPPPPPPFHWKYIQDPRMTLIHEYYCNVQIDHSRSSTMFWATNSSVILSKIAIAKTPATACLVLITEDRVDHIKISLTIHGLFRLASLHFCVETLAYHQYNVYMSVFHYTIFDLKHSINNIGIAFR